MTIHPNLNNEIATLEWGNCLFYCHSQQYHCKKGRDTDLTEISFN